MEIKEIKSKLSITEVAKNLGINIGKNQRALCPFHNDKTPSLQFSKEKNIATCFSSNCNLGTVDIIGLTERKLNINTHEALKYLTKLTGEVPQEKNIKQLITPKFIKMEETNRTALLKQAFSYFENSFINRGKSRNRLPIL